MHHAHSTARADQADWEPLSTHLEEVARLAAEFAASFGGQRAACLAGLLHDLGKFSAEFQAYIRGNGPGVDHSTAGAREVLSAAVAPADRIVAALLAHAIAGHHAGLPDRKSVAGGGLDLRLDGSLTRIPLLPDSWRAQMKLEAAG